MTLLFAVASLKVPAMIVHDVVTKVLDTEIFSQHSIVDLISGITFIVLFSHEKHIRWKERNARARARAHTHTHTHTHTKAPYFWQPVCEMAESSDSMYSPIFMLQNIWYYEWTHLTRNFEFYSNLVWVPQDP